MQSLALKFESNAPPFKPSDSPKKWNDVVLVLRNTPGELDRRRIARRVDSLDEVNEVKFVGPRARLIRFEVDRDISPAALRQTLSQSLGMAFLSIGC
jgi:hypothetical protein